MLPSSRRVSRSRGSNGRSARRLTAIVAKTVPSRRSGTVTVCAKPASCSRNGVGRVGNRVNAEVQSFVRMKRKASVGGSHIRSRGRAKPEDGVSAARERVLTAAYELFSRQGVRAVGIDAIIARADVAKMPFYHH